MEMSVKMPGDMTYPHPLHSRHCPKRSQCSQRSHCFECLNSTSPTQRGHKVNERNLVVRKNRHRSHKEEQNNSHTTHRHMYMFIYLYNLYKYSIS